MERTLEALRGWARLNLNTTGAPHPHLLPITDRPEGGRLGHNTWAEVAIVSGAPYIWVIYHNTAVVVYSVTPDGRLAVLIKHGGWDTTTTTKRIGSYLPPGWNAYRQDHALVVQTPFDTYDEEATGWYDVDTGERLGDVYTR